MDCVHWPLTYWLALHHFPSAAIPLACWALHLEIQQDVGSNPRSLANTNESRCVCGLWVAQPPTILISVILDLMILLLKFAIWFWCHVCISFRRINCPSVWGVEWAYWVENYMILRHKWSRSFFWITNNSTKFHWNENHTGNYRAHTTNLKFITFKYIF